MPDFFETVMPDLIGHPSFACMDTRVRGYDKDMDTRLRGYDKKVVMPDLIGHPCSVKAWIPAFAGMTHRL